MDPEKIEEYAWVGEEYVEGAIKGVVLSFHGLGGGSKSGPSTEELEYGRNGGLVVFPFYGPWGWMNRQSRAMIDEVVETIYEKYELPDTTPLIATGGSMGGQGSLLYSLYAQRKICACLANCPACDIHFHFNERPDLPSTFHWAFQGYPESLDELLSEHSPLHQVASMPDIPYRLIQGGRDKAVSKKKHGDKMVAAMRKHNLNVEYIEIEEMGHCNPLPIKVMEDNIAFVTAAMNP
jgi:hypothetical protein